MLALTALAAFAGGCSYRLGGGMFADKGEPKADQTASITPASATPMSMLETDLAAAKAAVVELFSRGTKDASQPWENPRTGARGTITPIASAYTQDGSQCRDFLASYLREERESWFQGGACRKGARWEVRELRPLQRS